LGSTYAEALRPHYPPQTDGSVLLPFRRLFVLAKIKAYATFPTKIISRVLKNCA
jgi:hypothetical protein